MGEFGTCNEGLHEIEISDSIEDISNPIKADELLEFVKQGFQNAILRKEFMVIILVIQKFTLLIESILKVKENLAVMCSFILLFIKFKKCLQSKLILYR